MVEEKWADDNERTSWPERSKYIENLSNSLLNVLTAHNINSDTSQTVSTTILSSSAQD